MDDDEHGRLMTVQERANIAGTQHLNPVIKHFPSGQAGEIVSSQTKLGYLGYASELGVNGEDNPYAPFTSKIDWEFARWAKLRGAGSTAVSELMGIEGVSVMFPLFDSHTQLPLYQQVHDKLGLSYKNSIELNRIIDSLPAGRPKFIRDEVLVAGETFDIYHRDILECIKALYSDPEFTPHLVFKPERHYTDQDETIRMYGDMYTGKWWWSTQVSRIANDILDYINESVEIG
jgi:hypothetical protein